MKLLLKYAPLIALISLVVQIIALLISLDYGLPSLDIYRFIRIEYLPGLIFSVLDVYVLLLMSDNFCDRFHIGCYKKSDGKWYLYPY